MSYLPAIERRGCVCVVGEHRKLCQVHVTAFPLHVPLREGVWGPARSLRGQPPNPMHASLRQEKRNDSTLPCTSRSAEMAAHAQLPQPRSREKTPPQSWHSVSAAWHGVNSRGDIHWDQSRAGPAPGAEGHVQDLGEGDYAMELLLPSPLYPTLRSKALGVQGSW